MNLLTGSERHPERKNVMDNCTHHTRSAQRPLLVAEQITTPEKTVVEVTLNVIIFVTCSIRESLVQQPPVCITRAQLNVWPLVGRTQFLREYNTYICQHNRHYKQKTENNHMFDSMSVL